MNPSVLTSVLTLSNKSHLPRCSDWFFSPPPLWFLFPSLAVSLHAHWAARFCLLSCLDYLPELSRKVSSDKREKKGMKMCRNEKKKKGEWGNAKAYQRNRKQEGWAPWKDSAVKALVELQRKHQRGERETKSLSVWQEGFHPATYFSLLLLLCNVLTLRFCSLPRNGPPVLPICFNLHQENCTIYFQIYLNY